MFVSFICWILFKDKDDVQLVSYPKKWILEHVDVLENGSFTSNPDHALNAQFAEVENCRRAQQYTKLFIEWFLEGVVYETKAVPLGQNGI